MIDDKIGIIGKIQGVRDKSNPNIKNRKRTKRELSLTNTSTIFDALPSLTNFEILSNTPSSTPLKLNDFLIGW